MKLSENFTLEELTKSKEAEDLGIENVPNNDETKALLELTLNVLQPLRTLIGKPIHINSGFRCKKVNEAVGGVNPTANNRGSQHLYGEAADIVTDDLETTFEIIRSQLTFDQLIWEFGRWIHVSYKAGRNRKEVLESYKIDGKTHYRSKV